MISLIELSRKALEKSKENNNKTIHNQNTENLDDLQPYENSALCALVDEIYKITCKE